MTGPTAEPPRLQMLHLVVTSACNLGCSYCYQRRRSGGAMSGEVLRAGGWTLLTAVCLMLFSLLHNPCSTTLYTVYRETGSGRWTAVAALLPLGMGFTVCFLVAQVWRLVA